MKLKMGASMVNAPARRTVETRMREDVDSIWRPSRSVMFLIASMVDCGGVVGWKSRTSKPRGDGDVNC